MGLSQQRPNNPPFDILCGLLPTKSRLSVPPFPNPPVTHLQTPPDPYLTNPPDPFCDPYLPNFKKSPLCVTHNRPVAHPHFRVRTVDSWLYMTISLIER